MNNNIMRRSYLEELIQFYLKYQKYPHQFNDEEVQLAIKGLCEIDYFNKLRQKIGYANMATLCNHMKIQFYHKSDVLYKYTLNLELVQFLIKGSIEELSFRFEEQKKLKNIEMKCMTDCYFATFDCFQFVNIIDNNDQERNRKFTYTVMLFNISRGNRCNFFIDKLYLIYQPRHYKKGDYIYIENKPVDGIYFIIKGEFLLSKRKIIADEDSKIKMIDSELSLLKQENHFYNYCLNRGISLKSKLIKNVGDTMKFHRLHLNNKKTALVSCGGLTKINERDIIGDLEYEQKSDKRMFTVECNSDIGLLWYISYEQLNLICNKDIKKSICYYAQKKGEIINKKYNNDILSSTIRNQRSLSPDVDNITITKVFQDKHCLTHSNDFNWKTKTVNVKKSTISKLRITKKVNTMRVNTISSQNNLKTIMKSDSPIKYKMSTVATSRNQYFSDIPRFDSYPSTNERRVTFKKMLITEESINRIIKKSKCNYKSMI